jgi:CrcB protein
MQAVLLVGLGGFIGSILRYGLGRVPVAVNYPIITMCINILGALVIGFISEIAKEEAIINPTALLFLQTGVCGGFTTFSTFSLETASLLQSGKYLHGFSYAVLSVILCLIGVWTGAFLASLTKVKLGL